FPNLIVNSNTTGEWQFVRMTTNHYSNGPVLDLSSPAMACYEDRSRKPAGVFPLSAGATVNFKSNAGIFHPGPLLFYMAKVPAGQSADKWEPKGDVWFKIAQSTVSGNGGSMQFSAKIPNATPAGEYLVRIEHIAMHQPGTPQLYIACGQVKVSGAGSGTPGPLVAFPGAYHKTDPSMTYNMHANGGKLYSLPGPAVWKG
ncbi:cellulose-growth-specific protein, partial [Microthyrium microscopicum]